jgi:T5SS/PEP-CTERM-associated repeat protein
VTGAGRQWNASASLIVGEEGSGTLNVEAGGLVTKASGNL